MNSYGGTAATNKSTPADTAPDARPVTPKDRNRVMSPKYSFPVQLPCGENVLKSATPPVCGTPLIIPA